MKLACALAAHYSPTIPMARKKKLACKKGGPKSNKFLSALNAMNPLGHGKYF
jgi:hypothetical protein